MLRFLTVLLLTVGLAPACSLLVAAAADLAELQPQIEKAYPGCKLTFSFASSGNLARQIAQGADFDLYLSANKSFVDDLARSGSVRADTVVLYARGRLGLWSSKGLRWRDLNTAAVSRIAMANPAHAPYGLAAKQVLERQGLWAAVQSKVVYGENVRQAWQFASTGNADVVIASWSLMHARGGQLLPASWHDPVLQVGAVTKRSKNAADARRFLDWLTSEPGQRLLRSAGFEPATTHAQHPR